ncbi:hypothetical protein ACIP5Y_04055 [Nocardia sp. NPDC088792]|uniref:WXG100-like domain-containing protein n=1 Tax=Nocardia sp. NPDC088792 TaxID=3364332 RepID=UPI00381662E8
MTYTPTMQWPEGLRWLWWIVGSTWPDGDEQHMFFMSDDWRDTAAALRVLLPKIDDAKKAALAAYPAGDGIEAISAAFDGLHTGDRSIAALAQAMEEISTSVFDTASDIQATKAAAIASVAALAVEILWAWVFPVTAAIVEEAAIVATKSILRVLEDRLVKFIESGLVKMGVGAGISKFVGTYAVKALESALISVLMDLPVQGFQKVAGERRAINGTEIGASVLGSVFGTIGGRLVGEFGGKLFDKLTGAAFAKMPFGTAARGFVVGTVVGAVSTATGGVGAGIVTGNWDFSNPASWVGGMARNGLTGMARGGFMLDKIPASGGRPLTAGKWTPTTGAGAPIEMNPLGPRGETPTPRPAAGPAASPGSPVAHTDPAPTVQAAAQAGPAPSVHNPANASPAPSVHNPANASPAPSVHNSANASPAPSTAPAAQQSATPIADTMGKPEDMKGKTRPKPQWDQTNWPASYAAPAAPAANIWLPGSAQPPAGGQAGSPDIPFTMTTDSSAAAGGQTS